MQVCVHTGGCAEMVLSIRVCTARGRVHVSAGESFARVCVQMAMCKAGAALIHALHDP